MVFRTETQKVLKIDEQKRQQLFDEKEALLLDIKNASSLSSLREKYFPSEKFSLEENE